MPKEEEDEYGEEEYEEDFEKDGVVENNES